MSHWRDQALTKTTWSTFYSVVTHSFRWSAHSFNLRTSTTAIVPHTRSAGQKCTYTSSTHTRQAGTPSPKHHTSLTKYLSTRLRGVGWSLKPLVQDPNMDKAGPRPISPWTISMLSPRPKPTRHTSMRTAREDSLSLTWHALCVTGEVEDKRTTAFYLK